jgi:hypothetical protein
MLFEAIAFAFVEHRFHVSRTTVMGQMLQKLCTGYVDRIANVPDAPYVICKTHDTCEGLSPEDCKYVFVYGDPLDSAASVKRKIESAGLEWFRLHQRHLRGVGDHHDLYKKDVLNYRGQLESWLARKDRRIICIDYDDLWDERERLSNFLGFDVVLPQRLPRQGKPDKTDVDMQLFAELRDLKQLMKKNYGLQNAQVSES